MPSLESVEVFMDEGQRLRGWITNAYAQIEFLVGDLILRCRRFSEYEIEIATFTHSATKRASKVRNMARKAGPLSPLAVDLLSIVDRFEERHETPGESGEHFTP
jgi:hypothetical protein